MWLELVVFSEGILVSRMHDMSLCIYFIYGSAAAPNWEKFSVHQVNYYIQSARNVMSILSEIHTGLMVTRLYSMSPWYLLAK